MIPTVGIGDIGAIISDRYTRSVQDGRTDPERRVAGPIGCVGCESLMTRVSSADRVWNETGYDTRTRTLYSEMVMLKLYKPKGFARDWPRIRPWG